MRKKIIGAIVCLMLTITSISVLGGADSVEETITSDEINQKTLFENDISMNLYPAPLFMGVKLDIKNNGAETVNNVEWSFRYKAVVTGSGIFIFGRTKRSRQINPN